MARYPAQVDLTEIDIETGLPTADPEDFDTRTQNVTEQIDAINKIIYSRHTTASKLRRADDIVSAVRSQLSFLAEQNRQLAKAKSVGPATLRIRVTRFGKLAKDFTVVLVSLEEARETVRKNISNDIVDDVVANDPSLERAYVKDAIQRGDLQTVLDTSEQRHQLQDLLERNRELEHITGSVLVLKELFTELQYLTEKQQSLINDIEHNVENVKEDVKNADGQLVQAERYKRRITKMKITILVIVLTIIAIIALILILKFT